MNELLQHPVWYVVAGTFIFVAMIGWIAVSAVAFVLVRELVAARLLDPAAARQALAAHIPNESSQARDTGPATSSTPGDRGNGSSRQGESDLADSYRHVLSVKQRR